MQALIMDFVPAALLQRQLSLVAIDSVSEEDGFAKLESSRILVASARQYLGALEDKRAASATTRASAGRNKTYPALAGARPSVLAEQVDVVDGESCE